MAKKIVLENADGSIEHNADTDHIKPGIPLIRYARRFYRSANRMRDGANVYVEYRPSIDPITQTLIELFNERFPESAITIY